MKQVLNGNLTHTTRKIVNSVFDLSHTTRDPAWQNTHNELSHRLRAAISLYPIIRDYGRPSPEASCTKSELIALAQFLNRGIMLELNANRFPNKLARRIVRQTIQDWNQSRKKWRESTGLIFSEGLIAYAEETLDFLTEQLPRTFNALPFQSVSQSAISKILRGFFGVQWYAGINAPDEITSGSSNRRDLFQLAYAYGSSYALIDNLIDTDFFRTAEDRDYFLTVILHTIEGADSRDIAPKSPYAGELARLWQDSRAPLLHRPLLKSWLSELVRAQQADSQLTHSSLTELPPGEAASILLRAGMMKASWTRVSAKAIATNAGFLDHDGLLFAGLNNQISNDLEGYVSDAKFGSATIFTHQVRARGSFDSIGMLLSCGAHSIEHMALRYDFPVQPLIDAFVVRLLESACELRAKAGPAEYEQILGRLELASVSEEGHALITAMRMLGPTPPAAHQEMLLLGGVDEYALQTWQDRHGRCASARRLIVQTSELYGVELERFIQGQEMSAGARHAMTGECSRIRPYLVLTLCELLNLPSSSAIVLAVAMECFHSASLILDDLPAQDNAMVRRGKPATHIAFGEAAAQLAAVELISLGFSLLASASDDGSVSARLVVEANRCFTGSDGLCQGQLLDLQAQDGEFTLERWTAIAKAKTGRPLAFCILVPVVASGAVEIEALAQVGLFLGVIYQARDDLADGASSEWAAELRRAGVAARTQCRELTAPFDRRWDKVREFLVEFADDLQNQIDDSIEARNAEGPAHQFNQPLLERAT